MKALLLLLPLVLLSCKNEVEAAPSPETKKEVQKEETTTPGTNPVEPGEQTAPGSFDTPPNPGTNTPPNPSAKTTPNLPRPKNTTRIPSNEDPNAPATEEPAPAPKYLTAQAIPGKPGWVFNPWSNTAVDVRGIPPGSLVRDPQDSDPDHKFRTPR